MCNVVEFHSGTISRVTGSTLAAESASMALAVDRHLFVRLLLEAVLYGEPRYGEAWRTHLKVGGSVVTDAKSLYDHMNKTGAIPKERQTHIDMLVTKDLLEHGVLKIYWVPTWKMLADNLTKNMAITEALLRLLQKGIFSVRHSIEDNDRAQRRLKQRQGQRQRRTQRKQEDAAARGRAELSGGPPPGHTSASSNQATSGSTMNPSLD